MSKKSLNFIQVILLTCVLSCLLLVVCEGTLRLIGFGQAQHLFVPAPEAQRDAVVVNPFFYARYFPLEHRDALCQLPRWKQHISNSKPSDSYRIFVFGGSVALGDVPEIAFNFPSILECMLRESFPDISFELHNLAFQALNSHVMRWAAGEAAQQQPDLFVVYMGNNEYGGPFGPAWSADGCPPDARIVEFQLSLRRLRLVQAFDRLTPKNSWVMSDNVEQWFKAAPRLHYDAPERKVMYANFAYNLEAICRYGITANAGVVLCTVGNNLRDMPPFSSLHRAGLSDIELRDWREHYNAAVGICEDTVVLSLQELKSALARLEAAATIDPTYAELQFYIGKCLFQAGEYALARKAFTLARDYDAFSVRADTRINETIAQVARAWSERGVLTADVESAFNTASAYGIMGNELFYDPVHVSFEGNYIIAASVFESIVKHVAARHNAIIPAERLSLEACKKKMGLSPYLEAINLRKAYREVERYHALHPRFDIESLRERIRQTESLLNERARLDAIEILEHVLVWRCDDLYFQRLLNQVKSGIDGQLPRLHVDTEGLESFPAALRRLR